MIFDVGEDVVEIPVGGFKTGFDVGDFVDESSSLLSSK
jgi:hypothetical protein